MLSAVVAVFDEYDEAQGAVNELIGAGFDKNEIRLNDGEALAFRHGNYVVTAIAQTHAKTELASAVMNRHHPVDVAERPSLFSL